MMRPMCCPVSYMAHWWSPSRTVSTPRWGEKVLTAHDYFVEHAQPNFYFHVAHAYALLRHSGVPLGKKDYLGQLSFIDKK